MSSSGSYISDTSDDDNIIPNESSEDKNSTMTMEVEALPTPGKDPSPRVPEKQEDPSPRVQEVQPATPNAAAASPQQQLSPTKTRRRTKTKTKRKRVSDRDSSSSSSMKSPRSAAVTSKLMLQFPGMKSGEVEAIVKEEKGWESETNYEKCVQRLEKKRELAPPKPRTPSRGGSTHVAHVCPMCSKSFTTSEDLVSHLEIHAKSPSKAPPKSPSKPSPQNYVPKVEGDEAFPGIKVICCEQWYLCSLILHRCALWALLELFLKRKVLVLYQIRL